MEDKVKKIKTCPIILGSETTAEGGIKISWSLVSAAQKYAVKRCDTFNGKFEIIGWTKGDSYVDKNVEKNKTYWYSVFAVRKISKKRTSVKSSSVYAAVVSDIEAPKSFDARIAEDNSIELKWDSAVNADRFIVLRKNNYCNQKLPVAETKEMTYTDRDIVSGQVYHYCVQAVIKGDNGDMCGSFSEDISLVHLDKGEILSVNTALGKKVKFMFRIVAGADGYILERSDDGEGFKEVGRTASGVDIRMTDKAPGAFKSYWYRTRAYKNLNGKEFLSPCTEAVRVKTK